MAALAQVMARVMDQVMAQVMVGAQVIVNSLIFMNLNKSNIKLRNWLPYAVKFGKKTVTIIS